MTNAFKLTLMLVLFQFACSNNKQEKSSVNSTVAPADNKQPATNNRGNTSNELTGEWDLDYIAIDKNINSKLDEEEKKDPVTQSKNHLLLNPDGTAKYYEMQIDCRYEIKEEGGKRKLYLYGKDNGELNKYTIYSVTQNELILLHFHGEKTFEVYKRVG